ncbi:hypothetical protein [Diaphorobacter sp. J5-51]|uniref:hypothetical protein n=1 Tax=Diaphorobacter sp. J5-51 TaxID=680496 RepID=UPI0018FEDBDE|nr:hypothetical protein [Diaphorobacter sp. J5-51]
MTACDGLNQPNLLIFQWFWLDMTQHELLQWSGRWEQHPVANSIITNVFSDPSVTEWTRLWTQVFGLVNAGRCG